MSLYELDNNLLVRHVCAYLSADDIERLYSSSKHCGNSIKDSDWNKWLTAQHWKMIKELYYDGTVWRERTMRDGKPDGLCRTWYSNGTMESEYTFRNGHMEGRHKVWYQSGKIRSDCVYKNGSIDGVYSLWYENGKPMSKVNYKDGVLSGKAEMWGCLGYKVLWN